MLELYCRHWDEAGVDEAGRGCLAGPVVAAAVVLPSGFKNHSVKDSKQLSYKDRSRLRLVIEREAIAYGVAFVFPEEIDKINILNASILAMHRALDKLTVSPKFIIVDGNAFKPYKSIAHQCIVKGDSKYLSIACASILAKTHRDAYMENLHEKYPQYLWAKNKGYPTVEHRFAISKFGATELHRKTFKVKAVVDSSS